MAYYAENLTLRPWNLIMLDTDDQERYFNFRILTDWSFSVLNTPLLNTIENKVLTQQWDSKSLIPPYCPMIIRKFYDIQAVQASYKTPGCEMYMQALQALIVYYWQSARLTMATGRKNPDYAIPVANHSQEISS